MPQLVYLSLTKWNTYEERPHHFVRWFHYKTGGRVLWVDPYPTRLPKIDDFVNFEKRSQASHVKNQIPVWLNVLNVKSLPIEPIPFLGNFNKLFWSKTIGAIKEFASEDYTVLVVGKPSKFANTVLDSLPLCSSMFDIMDSYSDFYTGWAHSSTKREERILIKRVKQVIASSTNLIEQWKKYRNDILLIRNGIKPLHIDSSQGKKIYPPSTFGYVGSMSSWFDWDWVKELACIFPDDSISLIGPVYSEPAFNLPKNIHIYPPVSQTEALIAMRSFKVGIIPFKLNKLTNSVDPVKYYEYTFSGLPTLSTSFGEMLCRAHRRGVYLVDNLDRLKEQALRAKAFEYSKEEIQSFTDQCSWSSRFNQLNMGFFFGD